MINRLSAFILTTTLLLTCSIAEADEQNFVIKPFDAVYDMYRQGDKLGSGKRSLKALGDNKFSLSLDSDIEWLIFSDKRKEVSRFAYTEGKITPSFYLYRRSGTGRDKELDIMFNLDRSLIIKPKDEQSPDKWEDGWLDEMSLHMQIQADLIDGKTKFEYSVITNSGKLKVYEFEVIGQELISTGLGRFNTIKVARVYPKDKFYAQHAWFIPELNHTLARLWRMKKGVEQYDLVISSYQEAQAK
ncbi:DUF3108 domain-containing protein [uncultured Psychrosphaera sp.]|uniref:DUF3108 domain-containing protein n=1 Tax=uncultured Psychrosphaera sp. TaxID=1403522 RepID=UPI00262EEA0E|nr:DUF3108 domain-containing protein [uncultured Psychrosphaera sp.]